MNKNMKRAQSPKRFNRHESKIMSNRERTGLGMRGPRTRDNRAGERMMLRTGIWEA